LVPNYRWHRCQTEVIVTKHKFVIRVIFQEKTQRHEGTKSRIGVES
jgi:hypothetical protein